jgi:flagellar hook-associated protein 2
MAGTFVSGLASNFDWSSIVTQMGTINRVPETQMKQDYSVDGLQETYFGDLNTKLATLQESINALRKVGGDVFDQKTATASNAGVTQVNVTNNTASNSSYSLNVTSIASFAMMNGQDIYTGADGRVQPATAASTAPINATPAIIDPNAAVSGQDASFITAPSSSGTININGTDINWSASDSLNTIAAKINSANTGVTAAYDASSGTMKFTTTATGSNASLDISESSGNFLEAMNINAGTTAGADAATTNPYALLNSAGLNMDITPTEGVFSVNNVKFYFDPSQDSISSLMNKITTSTAGVTASYDQTSGQVTLTQKNSGSANKIVLGSADDTSNILYALKLSPNNPPAGAVSDTISGTDAVVSVNNGPSVTRSSNVITDIIPGVSLSLTGTGSTSINVAGDTTQITNAVQTFVTAFNDVMTDVNDKLKETTINDPTSAADQFTGSLNNDSTLVQLKNQLTQMVNGSATGLTSGMSMLSQAGVDLQLTNNYQDLTLTFDSSKFNAALSTNFSDVANLFASNSGIGQSMYSSLNTYTSGSGPIDTEIKSLQVKDTNLSDQITSFEARMVQEDKDLQTQFSNMEAAMSSMKSTLSMLQSFAGTTTSSTSTATPTTTVATGSTSA